MTGRRRSLRALAAVIAGVCMPARGQTARRAARIGLLHPASAEGSAIYKALIPGLAELGYVDGRNIVVETRSGHGKPEALASLAAELVALKVEVLIVAGPAAVKAAIAATRTTPIVAIDLESDPVANGWMKSLSRPGGNVTGFFLDLTGMSVKWLQLLREAVPSTREVSLLWDATSGTTQINAVTNAASTFGIQVTTITIADWKEFDAVLGESARARMRALIVLSSPTAFQYSAQLAEFTARHRIPAISPFRPFAEAGGLMSYGPNLDVFFRRTASTIDRILAGGQASEVAVEQPTQYELVANLKAAKMLGLTLPRSFLLRADEVIQ